MMELVAEKLSNTIATVVGLSIAGPPAIASCFLKVNGKASWLRLLRLLLLPSMGVAVFGYLWYAGWEEHELVRGVAIAFIPMSIETTVQLFRGWAAEKEPEEAVRSSTAGCLTEAPASAALTLYRAVLVSIKSGRGADTLFVVSSVFSITMITTTSTKLHYCGTDPPQLESASTFFLQDFPKTVSQSLGRVFFAFFTRPIPEMQNFDVELQQKDEA